MLSKTLVVLLTLGLAAPAFADATPPNPPAAETPPDPPEALAAIAKAEKIAGKDLSAPLLLCRPDANRVFVGLAQHPVWQEPTKLFDNFYFVGSDFVGTFILDTSEGLILIDANTGTASARDHIVPDMEKLGLDPKRIKYVLVTHGHQDHYGGALYFQDTYGARVGLSEADWNMIDQNPPVGGKQNAPRRDYVIRDNSKLTLGGATIRLYLMPGHTPGTIGALIPVKDHGKTIILSLFGGTAFPPTRAADAHTGGLVKYRESIMRMRELALKAGAVGEINTHASNDGGISRMAALRAGASPNPMIQGTKNVGRFYEVIQHCVEAAIARPEGQPWK